MRCDCPAGPQDALVKALVVSCRIKARMFLEHDAAVIAIRADLGLLIAARDDAEGHLKAAGLVFDLQDQPVEGLWIMCCVKPARHCKAAVDLLAVNELADPGERRVALSDKRRRGVAPVSPGQLRK